MSITVRALISFLIVIVSGVVCFLLDTRAGVKAPAIYWAMGCATGIVAWFIITMGRVMG